MYCTVLKNSFDKNARLETHGCLMFILSLAKVFPRIDNRCKNKIYSFLTAK